MTERARGEYPALLPETQHIVHEIHELSGMPVDIRTQPALRGRARSAYMAPDPSTERHRVFYDPKYERYLDHLVAHECGHIVRAATASPSERVLPVMTSAGRYEAALQLLPEVEEMLNSGVLNERNLEELLPIWLSGTVSRLHDTPADIHIERWLHREFPSLRKVQEASLMSQAREAHRVLDPYLELTTPTSVWNAWNAMNYALMKSAAESFGRDEFVRPYRWTGAEALGNELAKMLDSTRDTGLVGDRQLSDRWAEHLGLKSWLVWRRVDDSPAQRWHTSEMD